MAQFNFNWNNANVLANANNTAQRASYRQKSVGGAWLTTGFTPANDLAKSATTVLSPVLTDNVVYEFKLESICTQNGPISNDNGVQEQIGFACISPTLENTDTTAQATLNLTGTDITKVQFTLRKSSDNTIVYGPNIVNRVGTLATAVASPLTAGTSYYWQIILFATVNGVEVNSGLIDYIGSVCGPEIFTTDAGPAQDLIWVPLAQVCETEGGFGTDRTITGLSSPARTWYDSVNNLMYVADYDSPAGNVYWFNPLTATTAADMTHSIAIIDNKLYNNYIDGPNRRIYFVGANTGGLRVYNIDTDSFTTVAFGTNGDFSRVVLAVTDDYIYCNDSVNFVIRIDRATLTILNTWAVGSLPQALHFNQDTVYIEGNGKLYVLNVNNAGISTVGVYDYNLNTHIGEITLPGVATWAGGFNRYWQTGYYDPTSNQLYVGDIGSSKRFVIDCDTDTVINHRVVTNKGGKSNVASSWTRNPVTDELIYLFSAVNTSADGAPIKRAYIEDRNTHLYTKMYENQSYTNLTHIEGTNDVLGTNPGTVFWNNPTGYDTDGTLMILSTSVGVGNTGRQITTTLQEVDANNGNAPTGQTKNNIPSDPDYVAPVNDPTDCPLTVSTACPVDLVTSFLGTTLDYEFSILSSVKNNPAIKKIEVYAFNTNTASVEGLPQTIVAPFLNNYYSGQFTGLGGSNYTIQIRYLDISDAVLATC